MSNIGVKKTKFTKAFFEKHEASLEDTMFVDKKPCSQGHQMALLILTIIITSYVSIYAPAKSDTQLSMPRSSPKTT